MSKHPKTIKQLDARLTKTTIDYFPFGKYKDHLVADVVKSDPNYIVWWAQVIEAHLLPKDIITEGLRNYHQLPSGNCWNGSLHDWDHWDNISDDDSPF